MNDAELLRYNRHLLLDGLDVAGQEALCAARLLLIGAGGLGCPAALYLAAAGVGQLTLVDPDVVEISNLQRQVAYGEADLGRPKVVALQARLQGMHAGIRLHPVMDEADEVLLEQLIPVHDVVLDGTDNFPTRHLVNTMCQALGKPLVSGAAIRWEGQVSVFDPRRADSPCYACLYPKDGADNLSCAEAGVFAPLCGTVGSLMAGEVLKVLLNDPGVLCGRLLILDQRNLEMRLLKLGRDPACAVCGSGGQARD